MAMPLNAEKSVSLADLRRQQKEMQAQISEVLDNERSTRFLEHVGKIVEVIAQDKELALGYIPLVRKDYIIRDVLRSLKNKKGNITRRKYSNW